jgi:hypothetical protein
MRRRFRRFNRPDEFMVSKPDTSGPGPIQQPGNKNNIFLNRWKARAIRRRAALAEQLTAMPVGPQKKQNIKLWLQSIEARETWLEARLEHLRAIHSILKSALE